MNNNNKSNDDEFYFEDDSEYEDYPGCGISSPPLLDPLFLLNPDRLKLFQYDGVWQKYDFLKVQTQPVQEQPGIAFINDKRIPINKRTNWYEYTNGISEFPSSRHQLLEFLNNNCPYCNSNLFKHQEAQGEGKYDNEDEYIEEVDEFAQVYSLEYCHSCGYWRWHDMDVFISSYEVYHTYKGFISKINEFDKDLPDGFTAEFLKWIRADERRWHTMSPKALEKLVADILRYIHGSSEVFHVGRPDDGGVDVIFAESEHKKWLVQVKRRESASCSEPVDTVRNLLGTMFLENSSYGMIFSTADHFTYRAYDAARRAREKGVFIELVDRGKLNAMVEPILSEMPWVDLVRQYYPNLVLQFDEAIKRKITNLKGDALNKLM